jgi:murein DD-endopeptidase MepM/ murein hydrolase activator NlpD
MSRGYYVRKVVQSDSLLIAGVKQDVAQIARDKKELEAQQAEQERLAAEYEAQKQQYVADLGVKQQILHGVQANRAQAEGELDELAQESERMTDVIRQLSETLRRRQEALRMEALAARRKREAARRQEGKPAARRQEEAEPPEIPTWNGDFMRPSDGRRTSGFGYRMHPILGRRRMHTGVDFGASYGSAIRAAASGVVILAQYNHGYGNCIIIDHGNNTTTLYGHASALLVSEGQTVQAGQVIARVGSTGLSTGPHLHFEVRRNGVPVSPPF